ncbi:MAG TPA: hypothetical protein P5530_00395 [Candidatus Diapherotrites archaeon]|nr:hypothetical protein [Candidatus Diapherotrites archaeon]
MRVMRRATTIKKPAVKKPIVKKPVVKEPSIAGDRVVKPKTTRVRGNIKTTTSEPIRSFLEKKNHIIKLESQFKKHLKRSYPESERYVSKISDVYLHGKQNIQSLRKIASGNEPILKLLNVIEGRQKLLSAKLIEFINNPKPSMFRFVEMEIQVENFLKEYNQIKDILKPEPINKKYHGKGDYNPRIHSSK